MYKTRISYFISWIFSQHSSTNLSTKLFLHLQLLLSKYSRTSHDLSHSHSQLLEFKLNLWSHIPFSMNYLHSHLHLSSFHLSLLWQSLGFSLQLLLQVSCHIIYLALLVYEIRLNTVTLMFLTTSGTHNFAYRS